MPSRTSGSARTFTSVNGSPDALQRLHDASGETALRELFGPLHEEDDFAAGHGFFDLLSDVVAHGMLSVGIVTSRGLLSSSPARGCYRGLGGLNELDRPDHVGEPHPLLVHPHVDLDQPLGHLFESERVLRQPLGQLVGAGRPAVRFFSSAFRLRRVSSVAFSSSLCSSASFVRSSTARTSVIRMSQAA